MLVSGLKLRLGLLLLSSNVCLTVLTDDCSSLTLMAAMNDNLTEPPYIWFQPKLGP